MRKAISNFLNNISIVRKTTILIAIAVFGVVYLGVFSYVSLSQLHNKFNSFYNTNYKSVLVLNELKNNNTKEIWDKYKKINPNFKIQKDLTTSNTHIDKLIKLHEGYAKSIKNTIDKEQQNISILLIGLVLTIIIISFIFAISIRESINKFTISLSTIAANKMSEYENLAQNYESKVTKEIDRNREKDQIMYHNARLAAMGEMIGNIAHQWRQPLNALTVLIQGFGTKSMAGKLDQKFIDQQVDEGLRLANQMSTTIEDFKNFFSPHDKREYFNVKDSLVDTLELVEFFAKDEQIDIQVIYDAKLRVYGYSNEFAQVIFNLINNARDNFKQRNIQDNRKILIKLEKKKKNHKEIAIISFTDNGGGVDPKIKDRIFEPYFTTKHKSTGTGIGLYMSKQIIEKQMQGLVTMKNIKSKLGGDTYHNCAQFIIAIPIR